MYFIINIYKNVELLINLVDVLIWIVVFNLGGGIVK